MQKSTLAAQQQQATIKAAIFLISSTLLASASAYAVAPNNSSINNNTINDTTINTSAINLAIMTEAPSLVSETRRVTLAAPNSLKTPAATSLTTVKADQAIYSNDAIEHPLWAKNGMVASQEALASDIGLQILKQGGNAVDAAVAVGFALAVTLPRAGNIGGGGFMMFYCPGNSRHAVKAALADLPGEFKAFDFVEHGQIGWTA